MQLHYPFIHYSVHSLNLVDVLKHLLLSLRSKRILGLRRRVCCQRVAFQAGLTRCRKIAKKDFFFLMWELAQYLF